MALKLTISENIRITRENLGYSQEYMAIQLGITQQAYSSLEKTAEKITIKRLKEIAKIFDVKIITLLDEDSAYIQQNYNQKGGYAATLINMSSNIEAYDKLIENMKEEIKFLRDLVQINNSQESPK